MNVPYDKICFILYSPGGCGTFIQNILYTSSKYSNQESDFEYKDGTAHAVKNDCFNNFHGVDINKNMMNELEHWQDKEIDALKSRDSLISYLEGCWNNKKYEYYSHRIATLTYYKLIDLLPESKFIYCKLDVLNTCRNLDTKLGLNDFNEGRIMNALWYFNNVIKDIDNFLTNNYSNVLILDIQDLIYNDDTIEIDKLIKFANMDVDREIVTGLVSLYRDGQVNLVHNPIWNKFLTAYEKLNK
tara:strand:- start:686 stop:1414 length:729 start_codon:yes stop_codon:yes gene_type:complete